jgi:hypothetical protein
VSAVTQELKRAAMLIAGLAIVTWVLWQPEHDDGENIMRVFIRVLAFGLGVAWQATKTKPSVPPSSGSGLF